MTLKTQALTVYVNFLQGGDTSAYAAPPGDTRRQLYSIYSSAGNGFEAFITEDGTLTIATASKKEFLAVPLNVNGNGAAMTLDDGHWHCIQVSHSTGKRPFGSSHLVIAKRVERP